MWGSETQDDRVFLNRTFFKNVLRAFYLETPMSFLFGDLLTSKASTQTMVTIPSTETLYPVVIGTSDPLGSNT